MNVFARAILMTATLTFAVVGPIPMNDDASAQSAKHVTTSSGLQQA